MLRTGAMDRVASNNLKGLSMIKHLSITAMALALLATVPAHADGPANECNTQIGNFDVMDGDDTIGKVVVSQTAASIVMNGSIGGDPVYYEFKNCLAADTAIFVKGEKYEGPKEIGLTHDPNGGDDMWMHFKFDDGSDGKLFLGNSAV